MGSEQGGSAGLPWGKCIQSWALSLALHCLLVGLVLLTWGEVRPPVVNEPFAWEVSLVGTPSVEASSSGLSRAPSQTQPRAPVGRAVEHRSLATHSLEAPTVVQQPEPTESSTASAERDSQAKHSHSVGEPVAEQAASPPASIQARHGAGSGPDYDWLKKLLWRHLEQVKHYPDHALAQGWEGRVALDITIEETGRIADVVVAESSGHVALDREAKALAQEVSLLALPRSLGAPRVRLRVPMRFGLE